MTKNKEIDMAVLCNVCGEPSCEKEHTTQEKENSCVVDHIMRMGEVVEVDSPDPKYKLKSFALVLNPSAIQTAIQQYGRETVLLHIGEQLCTATEIVST